MSGDQKPEALSRVFKVESDPILGTGIISERTRSDAYQKAALDLHKAGKLLQKATTRVGFGHYTSGRDDIPYYERSLLNICDALAALPPSVTSPYEEEIKHVEELASEAAARCGFALSAPRFPSKRSRLSGIIRRIAPVAGGAVLASLFFLARSSIGQTR